MKPDRRAILALASLALLALALGAFAAWRERMRPVREFAAVERARAAARELAARPLPALDALAERAHEDVLPADALDLPGLVDYGIASLDPKETPLVWHRSPSDETLLVVARGLRGEPVRGELGTLDLAHAPASFSGSWLLGVDAKEARVAVLFGRKNGPRCVLVLAVCSSAVDRWR